MLAAGMLGGTALVLARTPSLVVESGVGAPIVLLAELPPQARDTYRQIFVGGPFPFDKDGTVFGNRERLLPQRNRGYWREYTVQTPGVRHRGARRIVCGGPAVVPESCFYTGDHYASFRRIVR